MSDVNTPGSVSGADEVDQTDPDDPSTEEASSYNIGADPRDGDDVRDDGSTAGSGESEGSIE
ncbi:hypothetical protein WDJ51_08360 [Rathayibacter sp. YIM 133350]|uniref:hypothetical protein n=1 Tax=Rathayibacter sp. YIM 133350 TaxID=3131992 RepID=UPI00307D754B